MRKGLYGLELRKRKLQHHPYPGMVIFRLEGQLVAVIDWEGDSCFSAAARDGAVISSMS